VPKRKEEKKKVKLFKY